ncbi:hypothetical protein Smp_042080.1 [Schistosoma mansoni]|uniref:Protein MIS12 homolog n=1 Tax=Schistosoma mansoni TaxID=6183 RepID=G4VJT0_SCHMA|nr:hypothetical protein Smp_042080.1 [Schistosoma mansoni]|eukprot:XP_018652285.1 hypothetical protein Smp_042080.1 [Schistosoma mansoni]
MSSLDAPADLFKKLVNVLTTWLKTLDEFTKKEEEFANTSRNFSVDPKYWATTSELAYSVGNICECYKNTNQQSLLEPLKKICGILPSINDIFVEREEILKEINRKCRKIRKAELPEHGNEISGRHKKISQSVDSLTSRLHAIEYIINVNLVDLTSTLEVFLSSSFHAHLDCTYEFFQKASIVNQQMSDLLNTGQNELSLLDKKMDEDMDSIYKLLHLKPEK